MLATRKKMEAESIGQIMSSGDFETDASGRNALCRQAYASGQGMLHDSGNEMTKDSGKVHVKAAADEKDSIPIIRLQVGFDEYVSIVMDDIIYVETEKAISHGITYHTVNGSAITIISTLDEELKRLGDGFIKPHRSYLVNKRHVLGMKDGCLTLSNQEEIPCAFRLRSEVKRWIQ